MKQAIYVLSLAATAFGGQRLTIEEAATVTIARHPLVSIAREQVYLQEGLLRMAGAPFETRADATLSGSKMTGSGSNVEGLGLGSRVYGLSTSKQFRSGLEVSGSLLRSGPGALPGTTDVAVKVHAPLMRGGGKETLTAPETAARLLLEASELEVRHTVSQSVYKTLLAYWGVSTAKATLDVAREIEHRTVLTLEQTKLLVAADRIARADLTHIEATLAGKRADRLAAENELLAARQRFALALGLEGKELLDPPDASEAAPSEQIVEGRDRAIAAQATADRSDLQAARKRESAAAVLLRAARLNLRPQLDIAVEAQSFAPQSVLGQPGRTESWGVSGRSWSVMTQLSYSVLHRSASREGALAQAVAEQRQSALRAADLEREVVSATIGALQAVRSTELEAAEVARALRLQKEALDAEHQRFRAGLTTVTALLETEDRMRAARQAEISVRAKRASALTELRFVSGVLLDSAGKVHFGGARP